MQTIIQELLDHEGGMCVSLIVPTAYKGFGERNRVRGMLKNGVHTVEKALEKQCDKAVYKSLCGSLHALADQVDFDHPPKGVGMFVTDGLAKLVFFPFAVEQKVVLSDTFEIQDILYNLDKLMMYYVLVLSKKDTHLFKGMGEMLQEVKEGGFPKRFEDPYEEDTPAYHALYSKDPSKVEDKRVDAFMRDVHHAAAAYVKEGPLVLVGLDKHIHRYKDMGKLPLILGEIHAGHERLRPHDLAKQVWPVVEKYQKNLEDQLLAAMDSKMHRGEAVCGLEAVLNRVEEVYNVHLIVEKDFEEKGYLDREDGKLLLNPFDKLRYKDVPNIVEHVIEKVLKRKRGKVDVVGRNVLKDYGRIVLIG